MSGLKTIIKCSWFSVHSYLCRHTLSKYISSTTQTMFAGTMGDTCSVEGFKIKAMIYGRGLCHIHGDRKRYCRETGCTNLIQNNYKFIHHGAKKKECKFDECTNQAVFDGHCKSHGGRKECTIAGCTNPVKQSGMCNKHFTKAKKKPLLCVPIPNNLCPDAVVPRQVPGGNAVEVSVLNKEEGDAVLGEEGWKDGIWATSLSTFTRVVYRFGIFGQYSVGISWYLPYRYRRKIRSVHFGIKKGAVPPFFLKRGGMAPFLRSLTPFRKKRGEGREEGRGEVYRKGGNDTDRNTENPANLIPAKYRYRKNCW
jgi:hypothetical protein